MAFFVVDQILVYFHGDLGLVAALEIALVGSGWAYASEPVQYVLAHDVPRLAADQVPGMLAHDVLGPAT